MIIINIINKIKFFEYSDAHYKWDANIGPLMMHCKYDT